MDCQTGDGVGRSEMKLDKLYTIEECLEAVKQLHPLANGATWKNPCNNKCLCYAEFGMTNWDENGGYKSCTWTTGR